ncbi:MAG: agmatinase [Bacteroidetes bacterium]|nr:agmatinase [Bacteroidota bacterium]
MRKQIVNLLGIPYDDKSSFKKGAAKAPNEIRTVFYDGSSNYMTETGIDISLVLKDCRDIQTADYQKISLQISKAIDLKLPSVFLGGDHSITYPIVQALNKEHSKFDILHFDAHADIYDELDGDRFSHACPFARIMEGGLAKRLVSVGIRNMPTYLLDQAKKFGIEIVMMKDIANMKILNFQNPLYISIDLDVLDPAFAPGVSHHEPGGLSTRELINLLHQIKAPIIGADIVELNPDRDPSGITAALVAKLLKEVVGLIVLNANF